MYNINEVSATLANTRISHRSAVAHPSFRRHLVDDCIRKAQILSELHISHYCLFSRNLIPQTSLLYTSHQPCISALDIECHAVPFHVSPGSVIKVCLSFSYIHVSH